MVMVHGFGDDAGVWQALAEIWSTQFRVLRFNLAGHGRNGERTFDRERHDNVVVFADDTRRILEAYRVEDAVVVAHALGAAIAVCTANAAPHLVKCCVLLHAYPCLLRDDTYEGGLGLLTLERALTEARVTYHSWIAGLRTPPRALSDSPLRELLSSLWSLRPDIAAQFIRLALTTDVRSEFERLRHPALLISCRQDPLAGEATVDALGRLMAAPTIEWLDSTGHSSHVDVPEQVAATTNCWLEGLP